MTNSLEKLTSAEAEFLEQSNLIEDVSSKEALEDAAAAWEYAKTITAMTIANLLEIHRILMRRQDPAIAGKFRDIPVYIGGEKKPFNGKEILESEVREVLDHMQEGAGLPMVAQRNAFTRRSHVAFERVHPFADGNGRVGRILYNWLRLKLDLPLHTIWAKTKYTEYYPWFAKQEDEENEDVKEEVRSGS